MLDRTLRRAVAVATAALLATAGVAAADTAPADGDTVTPGIQDYFELGPLGTGGSVQVKVWFDLECNTGAHVDAGQSVRIDVDVATSTIPAGGSVGGTGAVIGPVPDGWPDDTVLCGGNVAPLRSRDPATVTLTAPDAPGVHDYVVSFARTLEPAGQDDPGAIRGPTRVFFELTVVPDAAPSLVLPGALTVEGTTTGGAVVTYAVGATDPEDATPPTPSCAPTSGSFFPLGATDVACTAEDSAGHRVSGSFTVSVVDTTPPLLVGVPGAVDLATTDPAGGPAAYVPPTATDIVDPAPAVACAPAPGSWVPVGTTVVECTARDGRSNVARTSFPLAMTYVAPPSDVPDVPAPPVFEVRFAPPIGRDNHVRALAGSVVPVRARVLQAGAAVRQGRVDLALARCDGGAKLGTPQPMRLLGGRWALNLRTSGLASCVRATVRVDGAAAGSFQLRLWSPRWHCHLR